MNREPDSNAYSRAPSGNGLAKPVADTQMVEFVYGANGSAQRDMTLRDYWRIMRYHAWLILSIPTVFTLLVGFFMLMGPDYYEGHARIEIDLLNANPPPSETENHFLPPEMDPEYFATQLQIIRSPMVLERVVKALDLENDPIYKKYSRAGGRRMRQLFRLAFLAKKDPLIEEEREGPLLTTALNPVVSPEDLKKSKELEPFVKDLQRRLTVEPVKEPSSAIKDTRLVSIVVQHPSPMLAAKLANAISDAMVYTSNERKLHAGKSTNAYLAHRIDGLQAEVREDERALATYAGQHNILSLEPSQNTEIERLAVLNRQLVEAENARKEAEADYNEALKPIAASGFQDERAWTSKSSPGARPDGPSAGESIAPWRTDQTEISAAPADTNSDPAPVLTSANALAEQSAKQIADLESRLSELQQKRAQLLVGATENWPEVKEVDQQIAAVKNSIEQTRSHATKVTIANLDTKYRQELAHENSIRRALESQRRVTQIQNRDAVGYRLLQQGIETKKNLLNEDLKRFNGNDVAQAAMAGNVRVVDYATLPTHDEAAGPWRLLWMILVSLITLALSVGLAFFVDSWDNTLRSSEEVRQVMQSPVLAVIPAKQGVIGRRLLHSAETQITRARFWLSRSSTTEKESQRKPG